MSPWSLLDKRSPEHSELYRPTVCLDELSSNFSVVVNAVLENDDRKEPKRMVTFVRHPYLVVYMDDVLLVLSDDRDIVLFKTFPSTVRSALLRRDSDRLIVFLDCDLIVGIDLKSLTERSVKFSMPKDNFSLAFSVEQKNGGIVLVNDRRSIFPNYLVTLDDIDVDMKYSVVPIHDENITSEAFSRITRLRNARCPLYGSSLCLKPSSDKTIEVFCPVSKQSFTLNGMSDIVSITTFEDDGKIMTLSRTENEDILNLSIAEFHSLKLNFRTEVGNRCTLLGASGGVASFAEAKNGKLYFYRVKEISPLSQLEILISLRNYEAAEQFAKLHNLTPTAVLEVKAKCFLNTLKQNFSPDVSKELLNILSSHNDINFIIACSCEGVESNTDLYPLLEFCKKRLVDNDDLSLNKRVDDLLWKVEAYRLVSLESEEFLSWQTFVSETAVGLCNKYIVADMLDCATIIWMKSYRSVAKSLKIRDVADLLCSISLDTKLNSLLRWLEYFIPSVNNLMPYSADLIITWAKDRICVLENSVHWPEVGIQFAEKFSHLMFDSRGLISFVPPSAEKVYHLINCMLQMQTLKKNYNIIISLRDFTTLCNNELAKLILRKAFTEDLECLFKKFLNDFIMRHSLIYDVLVREYIEELIASSSSIDEIRMEILLNCLYNLDEKYQCVVLVLKAASIPWSNVIQNIADNAVNSKHHSVPRIQTEILHADIRAVLMKYKCLDLHSDDFEYLIHLIVKTGDKNMMQDIEKVTNVYCRLKEDAYILCIQNYIERDQVNKALKVFDNLSNDLKESCVKAFVTITESQIDCPQSDKRLENNFIDFLRSSRIVESGTLESLNNIYILKNRFNVRIPYSEYFVKGYRKYSFITWCKEKIDLKNSSDKSVRDVLIQSLKLGYYLKFSRSETLLLFIEHCNKDKLPLVANIIMIEKSHVLEKSEETVKLILKLAPYINISDLFFLENSMKLILDIVQECDSKYLSQYLNICDWLTSIYFLNNNIREVLNKWKISSFYNPHTVTSIIPLWKELFGKNVSLSNNLADSDVCLCESPDRCINGSSCFYNTLLKLQTQQNDIHFVKIISLSVDWHSRNGLEIPHWLKELNDNMVKVLLSKMVQSDKPDHPLISTLLFSYSSPSEWLNDMLNGAFNMNKKVNAAHHIVQCKELYCHMDVSYPQALLLRSQNVINTKFESYGVSLISDDDSYNLSTLLEVFIKINMCSIDVIEEFCMVANIDYDQALMYYLFSMLKYWNDNYKFEFDNFKRCKIIIEKQDMIRKCISIVDKIKQKDRLVDQLTILFKNGEINVQNLITIHLNIYCYEVYIFILELLKIITGKQHFLREYMLLKFLQTYQRVTKPKQNELDEFSMKEHFPEIGFYRLPYQSVVCDNFWNNLKPEITLTTYKQWLPIAGILPLNVDYQVSRDMICSNAVKQSMTSEKNVKNTVSTQWSLHLRNSRLLKEAHDCIQHISNLEWAGACFYYVFQGSALGADQVAAVDMCYQFAEHWAKVEPNHNVVKKMQIKHLLTSTAHILHKIGLAEDKLLSLCDSPQKLIAALYNHESIISKYENPAINNAVDEIADKHNLNAGSLRMKMLERILDVNNVNLHSSMNKSISVSDGTLNRELLMRACYILKGTNQMSAALYLSRIGLGSAEPTDGYNTNIRALQCLLSLADSDVIEKVTKYRVNDLWEKLWKVYFINGLNLVGMEYLISVFNADKHQTIQQMWNVRDRTHLIVSFVIKLMIIYNVQVDNRLQNDIIKTIVKLDMIFEVEGFLSFIRLVYSPVYIDMWSQVLLGPFKRLDTPLIGHQKDECYKSLRLLPLCPVINQIDLSLIWRNCLRLGITDIAVTVLPHLSRSNRKILVERVGKIKQSTLQELKLIKSKGILTTNMVMNILRRELCR